MEIIKEKYVSDLACKERHYKKTQPAGVYHWHEKIEICYLKRGDFSFFADGEYITADTGDIVVFGEYSVHRFLQTKGSRDIYICQLPVKILISPGVTVKPLKSHITSDEIKKIPGLKENLEWIFAVLKQEGYSVKLEENPFFSNMAASLYFLLMKYFPTKDSSTVNKRQRQEFYRITEYINNHFTEDINVSSIANALCVGRGTVSDIFSKYAEVSISSYISSLRINHSNKLMENGYTISDAAFQSGFSSLRTFNYAYKREMGITPSEYLKKTKKN